MPLEKGDTPAIIGHNVKIEERAGKRPDVAQAIALHTAKDSSLSAPAYTDHYEEQSEMGANSNHIKVNVEPVASDSKDSDYATATTGMTIAEINAKNRSYWERGGKSPEVKDCARTDKMQKRG
jgi:hypothetical protein